MADFRLGRLKFKWQGNWTAATAYVIDDIVKYGGNSYVCTTNHTSAANETLFYSSDLSNWSVHTEGTSFKGDWAATTWYKVNDIVKYGNTQYRATNGFTTGATFDNTNLAIYLEGLKFESTWVANTNYQKGDIITYGGYSYTSISNHQSATTPNADTVNWQILSTGFKAKGVYAANTAYVPGDVVRFGGHSYSCKLTSTNNAPTDGTYWDLITEGFNWLGAWTSGTIYQLGDVVNRNSNSYVCKASNVTGASTAPELDPNGAYWNYVAQGGSAAQVLQNTGDLLYQAASGINRISLPTGSTGTAAQIREASGQVLTVGGSPLLPRWETNNTTTSVYYVAETGDDTNNGRQISRAFASVRHACDYISALTGADKPSVTNPVSVYIKAGIYSEKLPIQIPPYVSLLGDNIRATVIKPSAGDSDLQALVLGSSVTSLKLGDTVSNSAGTKTGKVLDSDFANNVHILNLTGGVWTTSDKYVDIISNKHADARDLLNSNKTFIAHEAYHRHVANNGAVSGTEATVKSRLEAAVEALMFNVKAGSNDKVYDYANALVGGTAITGNDTQDTQLLNNIDAIGGEIINGLTVTKSAGNNESQVAYTGTADTASPKCATVKSAFTTLVGIVTTAISNGNMSGATKTEPFITITSAGTRTNNESTMFFLGTHTIVKDIVMEGLSGFVPNGSDDKDIDGATVKGVYFRIDPNSPITKSPYVQNCSVIGGAAVGVFLDGGSHRHFDNSPTPSFKSMCFDAFTQVLEGGVGFYLKGTSSAEIVSSFTYYAHISYCSTGGARIRAVSGNSSYGKYGCIARGFDAGESTINGTIGGLMLTTDANTTGSGSFNANERFTGGTSNAVGELRSDQSAAANRIYFHPITGTFANGETITGVSSSASRVLAGSNAVTGQKGFLLVAEGLTAAPDQGGSIEMQDDGVNNDNGSYVISNSSYAAPDGRGTLTVTRAQLGSTAASHTGTSTIALFPAVGQTASLQSNITAGAASPHTMNVDAVTGMTIGGYLVINNELFQVSSFPSATSVTATRAQEGTTAGTHNSGATIKILGAKVASQDEVIKDFNSGATGIRVKAANVTFKASDVIKIDNEFMHISGVAADTTGLTVLTLADEKTIGCTDGQSFKTRYRYSQVRLTAHDFLDVGTGNRANTNWPYLPLSPNVPAQETDETRPGRVYFVSTDQDGNFAVGKFFRVEQATGKATLDASAFDLSGLQSLRLGSIGAQLGASINEFSTDGTLSQNSDEKCPTQKAVKTYVDGFTGVTGDFTIGGNLTVSGTQTTINTATLDVEDKNVVVGKVSTPSDTTANLGGLTLKGTTDKTINWVNATDCWTSSENWDLPTGKGYHINNAAVLTATTLGSGVLASSLTSVGTLTGLTVSGVTELQSRVGIASATENVTISSNTSGNTDYNLNTSAVFYHNSLTGDITVNFTNVPTAASKAYTIAIIFNQGGTARTIVNNVTINGGSSTAINWTGGTQPTGQASKKEVFSLNLVNISATATPSWLVFGSSTAFG